MGLVVLLVFLFGWVFLLALILMSRTEAEYRQGTMNGCLFKIQTSGLNKLIWKSAIAYKGESKGKSVVSSKNE